MIFCRKPLSIILQPINIFKSQGSIFQLKVNLNAIRNTASVQIRFGIAHTLTQACIAITNTTTKREIFHDILAFKSTITQALD